jgi:hypothetical protein
MQLPLFDVSVSQLPLEEGGAVRAMVTDQFWLGH